MKRLRMEILQPAIFLIRMGRKTSKKISLKSDRELHDYVKSMTSSSTAKKTAQVTRRFKEWIFSEKGNVEIEEISPEKLNNYIGNFLLSAKKVDSTEYEPDTLTGYHHAIER